MNSIAFTGKAYFLDCVFSDTPLREEQKERIERYAAKLDDNTDVVVIGCEKEPVYEYQGKTYNQHAISNATAPSDTFIKYKLKTDKGAIIVKSDEIKRKMKKLPVYNAYIINGKDKDDAYAIPMRKKFDFRYGSPDSTVIDSMNIEYKDIAY